MADTISSGHQNDSLTSFDEAGWLQRFDEYISGGDPMVRKWFLVRQPFLPGLLCLIYVLFSTRIGPAFMKNRAPFDLRKVMIVFNFSLVAIYVYSLWVAVVYIPKIGWELFCKGAHVKYGDDTYTVAYTAWIIYLIKYIEFFDTVFFVLRKKDNLITNLHVVHHTVVPILGWIMLRIETGGMQSVPVIINTIVHVVMYSYYGLAAIGPSTRKYLWWKKYLTQIQMVQFVTIIIYVIFVVPASGCQMKISSFVMDIFFGPFFLYLFYQYYRMAYKNKND